jgi:glycosyltransferase involved in cell wall biosynthesis
VVVDPAHLESELRAAIRMLVDTPELGRLLGRLARERAVSRFSLARNLDALLELYASLAPAPSA